MLSINPISNQYINTKNSINTQNKKKKVNTFPIFRGSLAEIERNFANKGVATNFSGSLFVAECSEKIADKFSNIT